MIRTALMAFTALCVASGAFAQSELAPLRTKVRAAPSPTVTSSS